MEQASKTELRAFTLRRLCSLCRCRRDNLPLWRDFRCCRTCANILDILGKTSTWCGLRGLCRIAIGGEILGGTCRDTCISLRGLRWSHVASGKASKDTLFYLIHRRRDPWIVEKG